MPSSRKYRSNPYDTNLLLGIGGKVSKKDKDLKEFAGYDLETALEKAAIMAFSDNMSPELKAKLPAIMRYLDLKGKAYFMTEGSTELTQLLVRLGDDRRQIPSAKNQQQKPDQDD